MDSDYDHFYVNHAIRLDVLAAI